MMGGGPICFVAECAGGVGSRSGNGRPGGRGPNCSSHGNLPPVCDRYSRMRFSISTLRVSN